jgi:hypothetical protein
VNAAYVYQSAQIGEFRPAILFANGPASYSQTAGDPLYNAASNEYISFPMDCTTQSGLYLVRFVPSATGANSANIRAGAPSPGQSGWTARWFYSSVGNPQGVDGIVIATAGTGQTNGTYTINASGGGGTGAVAQITIAGGAITAVKVLNPGTGYTSVPTFTVAEGGTPGTLTATVGFIAGTEVGTGTNLSAESVQFGAFVSQL